MKFLEHEKQNRSDWTVQDTNDGYLYYEDCTIQEIVEDLSWDYHRYGVKVDYCLAYDKEMNCYLIYPNGEFYEVGNIKWFLISI